jgi:hypothetical protein
LDALALKIVNEVMQERLFANRCQALWGIPKDWFDPCTQATCKDDDLSGHHWRKNSSSVS